MTMMTNPNDGAMMSDTRAFLFACSQVLLVHGTDFPFVPVYNESMSKTILAFQAQLIQLDSTKYAATRQDVLAMEDAYMLI
jgi:hypothetical protein